MSIAKIFSRAITGMQAPQIIVEVHVASGLPSFSIVGLPDVEVRESRDRVRSAIQNSGFEFPARRITVNLAPADLPKESSRYDLPIALGIVIAAKLATCKINITDFEFAGELALDGQIRPIKGSLAMAFGINTDKRNFVLPHGSADEASLIKDLQIYEAQSLKEVIDFISGEKVLSQKIFSEQFIADDFQALDIAQVKGQTATKKALEIAAAGRHSLLMIGNPGCGKSMLAQRIQTIMPRLTEEEAIETASLHSISTQGFKSSLWKKAPYRAPHHSTSAMALIGGGSNPKPGEISLAHNGVLFLDELPEFERKVLEVLREPLENKKISIARANHKVDYLADFQLIAAMNPCPCGNHNNPHKVCKCSIEQINRYQTKISGPLLDRIDIIVDVPSLTPTELQNLQVGESSAQIAERVAKAREIQLKRQGKLNYQLENNEIEQLCALDENTSKILQQIVHKNNLSARGYFRLLKLSRTIADLDNSATISVAHLSLANQYKRVI